MIGIITQFAKPFARGLTLLLAAGLGIALSVVLTSVSGVTASNQAQTLCVRASGAGCYTTISDALAAAAPNDTIRVATGVYSENVTISMTLALEGGWNSNFTIRDANMFSSTITPSDETRSVVSIIGNFGSPGDVAPTFDGFIVTGGRADLGGNHGGGVSIGDSNAIVRNNVISDNVAYFLGGGVWVQRGAPLFENNRIENNRTSGSGGGVQLENTQAILINNIIANNVVSETSTAYGGGIDITSGYVRIYDSMIISNVLNTPTGITSDGGGVSVRNAQAEFSRTQIQGNTAIRDGGGIWNNGVISITQSNIVANQSQRDGGGIFNSQMLSLTDSLMSINVADSGGGLYNAGNATLHNSLVFSNYAGDRGGGIENQFAISLTNTSVSNNQGASSSGGIYNESASTVSLFSVTMISNTAPFAAGLNNSGQVHMINSIMANHAGGNCVGGLTSLGHNLEDSVECGLIPGLDDQPNTDPQALPLALNGGSLAVHALADGSPAIDAGDNATCPAVDQRGAARPVDGDGNGTAICDIGAFEYGGILPRIYLPFINK